MSPTAAPTPAPAPIRTATAGSPGVDVDRVVAVVALAFAADPAMRALYPDPQQYLTYGPAFVRAFGGSAFEHGVVDSVAGYAGAALWLPPGVHADEAALGKLLEASVAPDELDGVAAAFGQFEVHHPHAPHWYLPLIGVDPAQRGRGYGAALLRHALARCDRDGAPAYLEATSPRNRALYERHGFAAVGTIRAGAWPPIWPMVRRPR
jgi:GNAT superfamily N-acetyltransferase